MDTEEMKMISRIWHGWTTPANADAYESLLRSEIFQGIQDRQIAGYRGIQLLRRNVAEEVEFVTIMWFDSLDAVRTFAGEDYEAAVVPPKARALLSRFDARSQHYEVITEMTARPCTVRPRSPQSLGSPVLARTVIGPRMVRGDLTK
jgi:heme-degrading monooxygenase HmoA